VNTYFHFMYHKDVENEADTVSFESSITSVNVFFIYIIIFMQFLFFLSILKTRTYGEEKWDC
jgi:hypothetical protein